MDRESSLLKTKNQSIASRFCDRCGLGIEENVWQIVMQCPFYEQDRKDMLKECTAIDTLFERPEDGKTTCGRNS